MHVYEALLFWAMKEKTAIWFCEALRARNRRTAFIIATDGDDNDDDANGDDDGDDDDDVHNDCDDDSGDDDGDNDKQLKQCCFSANPAAWSVLSTIPPVLVVLVKAVQLPLQCPCTIRACNRSGYQQRPDAAEDCMNSDEDPTAGSASAVVVQEKRVPPKRACHIRLPVLRRK